MHACWAKYIGLLRPKCILAQRPGTRPCTGLNISRCGVLQAGDYIHAHEVILTFGMSRTTLMFLREAAKKRDFQVAPAMSLPYPCLAEQEQTQTVFMLQCQRIHFRSRSLQLSRVCIHDSGDTSVPRSLGLQMTLYLNLMYVHTC